MGVAFALLALYRKEIWIGMYSCGSWKKKPFQCSLCQKNFSTNPHLNYHVATVHEGKKPFTCDICSKGFTERKTSKAQIKVVHEGQKRFKCNVFYYNYYNTYLAILQQFMKESSLIIATFDILALHQIKDWRDTFPLLIFTGFLKYPLELKKKIS